MASSSSSSYYPPPTGGDSSNLADTAESRKVRCVEVFNHLDYLVETQIGARVDLTNEVFKVLNLPTHPMQRVNREELNQRQREDDLVDFDAVSEILKECVVEPYRRIVSLFSRKDQEVVAYMIKWEKVKKCEVEDNPEHHEPNLGCFCVTCFFSYVNSWASSYASSEMHKVIEGIMLKDHEYVPWLRVPRTRVANWKREEISSGGKEELNKEKREDAKVDLDAVNEVLKKCVLHT